MPMTSVRADDLQLLRGEALTLFCKTSVGEEDYRQTQVEVRVTSHGEVQVFCDKAVFRSFNEWDHISTPPKSEEE